MPVVRLLLVEDVTQRIPMGGALHTQMERVVRVADLVPILPAGNGVGPGRQHLMDGIEASSEEAGLRAVAVEGDAERKHLARADQACGLDDVLRRDVVERADLIVFAPAAPVAALIFCFRDRLLSDIDVYRIFSHPGSPAPLLCKRQLYFRSSVIQMAR